jgi:hypothetical protein
MASTKLITELLEKVVARYPAFVRQVRNRLPEDVSLEEMRMDVLPPEPTSLELPTFDPSYQRPLSSMLKARFEFGSDIYRGYMRWLSIEGMRLHLRSEGLLQNHRSLREHWEGSAPMQCSDRGLSLFAIDPELSTDLVYLVWQDQEQQEPELWLYCGMEEKRFADLAEFLAWCASV